MQCKDVPKSVIKTKVYKKKLDTRDVFKVAKTDRKSS